MADARDTRCHCGHNQSWAWNGFASTSPGPHHADICPLHTRPAKHPVSPVTGRVVRQPKARHHCNPPEQDTTRTITSTFLGNEVELHPVFAGGTVWQCECGRRWRATYPYVNLFVPTWKQTWLSVLGFRRPARPCDCFIEGADLPNPSYEPCPVHRQDRLTTRPDARAVQPG